MKKLWLILSVVVVSFGIFSYSHFINDESLEKLDEDFGGEEIVKEANRDKEEHIANLIDETHRTLNLMTGFGAIERYSHPDEGIWVEAMTRLQKPLEKFEANLDYVSEAIYEDLKNFVLVTRYALYEKNQEAMLYSHRIMHDLDVAYNGYNESIFGVTKYASGNKWGESNQHQVISEIVRKTKANPIYAIGEQ